MVVIRAPNKPILIRKDVFEVIPDVYSLAVYVTLCACAQDGQIKLGTKDLAKACHMGVTKFKKCKKLLSEIAIDGKPLIEVIPLVEADGSRGYDTIIIG